MDKIEILTLLLVLMSGEQIIAKTGAKCFDTFFRLRKWNRVLCVQ